MIQKDKLLIDAAIEGNPAEVARLIAAGANVNAVDKNGYTALMWAASYIQSAGADRIVADLISAGADVDMCDDEGRTALMISAWWSHAKTVTALIAAGANVDAHDHDGNTALMLAAREGNTESILALTIAPEAARIAGHMLDATTRRK